MRSAVLADAEGEDARHTFASRGLAGGLGRLARQALGRDHRLGAWPPALRRPADHVAPLTEVGTLAYDAILPEASAFDHSGAYPAVTYDHFDDPRAGSSIGLWRLRADPLGRSNVQLVKTEYGVPAARSARSMDIARRGGAGAAFGEVRTFAPGTVAHAGSTRPTGTRSVVLPRREAIDA